MGWSTRQLAELAGTTLRAIRHYHEVGLLAEPQRRANGYKSYGAPHLVRVLRIKRLTGLGLSLAQIAELGDAEEHPEEALKALDAELAATIERLQRVRTELGLIMQKSGSFGHEPEVAEALAGTTTTKADRDFVVVMSRLVSPEVLAAYSDMIRKHVDNSTLEEFNLLPADADEQTRQELAERLGPVTRAMVADLPEAQNMFVGSPVGLKTGVQAMVQAMRDLYNEAQLDVLVRMNR